MKTKTLILPEKRIIFWICMCAGMMAASVSMKFTAQWIKPLVDDFSLTSKLITLIALNVVPTIIIAFILYSIAIARKYPKKLNTYLKRQLIKRRQEHANKVIELKQDYKNSIQQIKEMYSLSGIITSERPLVVLLKLNEDICTEALPIVKINNWRVNVALYSKNLLICYIKKYVTAETHDLIFSIGNSSLTIKNPYFMAPAVTTPIKWQCKGHEYERKILLPKDYFPNATDGVKYEFVLRIHQSTFGTFFGWCDPGSTNIVIPLGKEISASECAGKEVTLYITYGKGNKIILPQPIIMTVEGKPVPSKL